MNLLWLAVILLALSWYPLTGLYAPANIHYTTPVWFAIVALWGAFVCTLLSRPYVDLKVTRRGAPVWLVISAGFVMFVPLPYSLPALFLLMAIVISLLLELTGVGIKAH